MPKKKSKCEICNDSRQITALVEHPYTKQPMVKTRPCVCVVSELVSDECPLLKYLGDTYLPFESTHKSLQFDPDNVQQMPNKMISGDYDALALNVKTIMMKHRFDDDRPLILFCRAIDILHDFYVQQKDGTSPHLSDTNKYSLIVMSLDTQEKNDKLKTCIAQVVYMRKRQHLPTWIYLPEDRPSLRSCAQEYSEDLERYVEDYHKVVLKVAKDARRMSTAVSKSSDAESFTGLAQ